MESTVRVKDHRLVLAAMPKSGGLYLAHLLEQLCSATMLMYRRKAVDLRAMEQSLSELKLQAMKNLDLTEDDVATIGIIYREAIWPVLAEVKHHAGWHLLATIRHPTYTIASWRMEQYVGSPIADPTHPLWDSVALNLQGESQLEHQCELWNWMSGVLYKMAGEGSIEVVRYEDVVQRPREVLTQLDDVLPNANAAGVEHIPNWTNKNRKKYFTSEDDSEGLGINEVEAAVRHWCPARKLFNY